jgi:8-oxo-dGTP pyrophosphatase MutT (NUDIX family)
MTKVWKDSYDGMLRAALGSQKLIIPSIRAIIFDKNNDVLFIKRKGSGKWALPAGGIEINESIFECLQREVGEETGLHVLKASLIALYTGKEYCIKNRFGNEYQGFEFLFRVDEWSGELKRETDETTNIGFFPIDAPPSIEGGYWEVHHAEVIEDLKKYNGTPAIK